MITRIVCAFAERNRVILRIRAGKPIYDSLGETEGKEGFDLMLGDLILFQKGKRERVGFDVQGVW